MFRRLVVAGLAVLAAGFVSAAQAEENLVVIATETVDLGKDGVSIDVSKAKGAFRGIRIRAKKNFIDVSRVQVIYDDGAIHNEDRQIDMKQGERSRAIDLKSSDRFIDTVNISNKSGKGIATVEVLGIQSKDGAKKERAKAVSGVLPATPTTATPSTAKPLSVVDGNDVMFGYQDVGFVVDKDVIKVGGNIGKFERIRMRVLKNDVHLNSVKIVYLDGEAEDVAVDADIKANTKTKWIELKNSDRFIKEIQLSYRSKANFKGQARIEVTGQYAADWLGKDGEGRKYNDGWVLLGSQTADYAGYDTDSVTVGKNEGGFARLRLIVRENPITLTRMTVAHFTGPDESFNFNRERIDPDKPYGPIEFKGGKTAIKEIRAQYRSRVDLINRLKSGKGVTDFKPAVVEIWGQH
jgi:Protein of unknown function (DUF2541)